MVSTTRWILLVALLALPLAAKATTTDTRPETRSNPEIATPEAAKAELYSGGVGYSYTIDLPPAAGITPNLQLSFSSLTGNTEYGKGWSLNLSKIERSTRTGVPTYEAPYSGADEFELDGSLFVKGPITNRFHLEQVDHRRILYAPSNPDPDCSDSGSDYWEITNPDGTKFLYGCRSAANSKLTNDGRDDLPPGTFRWSLDKVIDPRGNYYLIDYEYETFDHRQPGGELFTYNMNNHPLQIRYSYHDSASGTRKRRIVDFEWKERGEADWNDDRPTSYRSGFKIQISQRLANIYVGTDTEGQIRGYEFIYSPKPCWDPDTGCDDPDGPETRPVFSQLAAIQRYGRNDDDAFPSQTTFQYTRPNRGYEGITPVQWDNPSQTEGVDFVFPNAYDGYGLRSAIRDMNGDSFVDYVYTDFDGKFWVAYGPVKDGEQSGKDIDGNATDWGFATPVRWNESGPLTYYISDFGDYDYTYENKTTTLDLIDMHGDGLPDLVAATGDGWYVYRNLGNGFNPDPEPWNSPGKTQAAPLPYAPYVRNISHAWRECPSCLGEGHVIISELVDVNGDGRPDHVQGANNGEDFDVPHGDVNLVWVSINQGDGFDDAELMPLLDVGGDDGLNYLGTVYNPSAINSVTIEMFADANGDGLADRFGHGTCLRVAVQEFSLGNGWQTSSRSGQGSFDNPAVDPAVAFCEDFSGWPPATIYPEYRQPTSGGTKTVNALLDLNGDGILDYFHGEHETETGLPDDWGTVWFGLGDGTYLTLRNEAAAPSGFIPPGVEWKMLGGSRGFNGAVRTIWSDGMGVSSSGTDTIDMNGDGLVDRVHFLTDVTPYKDYYFVYFHPGPSGLLETVTNELGGVTRFEYQPSTWFRDKAPVAQTSGEGGDDPNLPASARTSAPKWVLTNMIVEDGRTATQQTQSIEYADLLYDYHRHEYIGTRMAETIVDPDGENVLTRSFFHQSTKLRPRLEFTESTDDMLNLLRTEKTDWISPRAIDEDGNAINGAWFPQPTRTVTRIFDPIDENAFQEHIVDREFDAATGNLTKQTDWGPDGALGSADDFIEAFIYFGTAPPSDEPWLVSYPQYRYEKLGTLVGKVEGFYYDNQPLGDPPTEGLVTGRATARGSGLSAVYEKWVYDFFGNQTEYLDPRAVMTHPPVATRVTVYDDAFEAFPVRITNRLGHETEYRFNTDFGEVEKVLDPNGYLRCWEYDDFGRLEARMDSDSTETIGGSCPRQLATFDYSQGDGIGNPLNQLILTTEYAGSTSIQSRQFLDGLGRVYQEESEQREDTFAVTVRGWGTRGELTCESLPFEPVPATGGTPYACETLASPTRPILKTTYDDLLRPLHTARALDAGPGATEISRAYSVADLDQDGVNEVIETRTIYGGESLDRIIRIGSDPQGRVVAIDESPLGGLTVLERDAKGRIVTVDGPDITLDKGAQGGGGGTDPNELSLTYNHVDQRMSLSGLWPSGTGSWNYSYDLNGNLSEETSPTGTTIGFHWDPLNRLGVKDYNNDHSLGNPGPEDVDYTYDSAANGFGRLASVENPGDTNVDTSYSYTIEGRVQSMVRNFGSSGAFQFTYVYDRLGRLAATLLPSIDGIERVYNGSVLTNVNKLLREGFSWTPVPVADNVQLHPSGAITYVEYPRVAGDVTYQYHLTTHRLDSIVGNASGSEVQNLTLAYDTAGNLLSAATGGDVTPFSQTFAYDSLHRLRRATCASCGGPSDPYNYGTRTYGYNEAGNLRYKGDLKLLYEGDFVDANPHAVTRVEELGDPQKGTYTYDDDGGLLTRTKDGAALNFTRDDDGRIADVNSGAARYIYDEAGQRSRKTVSGGDEILYVDPSYEVNLSDSAHQVHYFHGSRRVATENRSNVGLPGAAGSTESWQYYFPDFVGSNTVVASDSGLVQESFFRPFGEFEQEDGVLSDYLFTDQENDPESGLQYFGARYYDPWVGRFMSQDPELISAHTGVTFRRIAGNPQQNNAYSYALNAPTRYTDPTGRAVPVSYHTMGSGYTIHYSPDSLVRAGVTHVGGVAIGSVSGGGNSGGRSTSAAKDATGADQIDSGAANQPGNNSDPLLNAELETIRRVQEKMHGAKEFTSEVHQREGAYEVTPAEEQSPHSATFEIPKTLVTVTHSHTSDAGYGSERGSRDQNTARGAAINVITVYPGGKVTRIDTRGNVFVLEGDTFAPLP